MFEDRWQINSPRSCNCWEKYFFTDLWVLRRDAFSCLKLVEFMRYRTDYSFICHIFFAESATWVGHLLVSLTTNVRSLLWLWDFWSGSGREWSLVTDCNSEFGNSDSYPVFGLRKFCAVFRWLPAPRPTLTRWFLVSTAALVGCLGVFLLLLARIPSEKGRAPRFYRSCDPFYCSFGCSGLSVFYCFSSRAELQHG
jgi:hypothetical protein